jgi:PTH1 family peptidyl-tRNA hydrolase
MADERHLVVGLGNPGERYAGTRHNAGFMVLEELAARAGAGFKSRKSPGGTGGPGADVVEGRLAGCSVVLAKPRSYMNESGGPVAAVARFYKIAPEEVIVVQDELDLPFGVLRLKRGGSEGGHNGIRSVVASLGSPEFVRVRIGVGRPPGRGDAADHVLRDFSAPERRELPLVIDQAADAVEAVLSDGLEAAQNRFNGG